MTEPMATEAGPDAPKRRGRPPGVKRKTTDRELIGQLARRLDEMQAELEKAKAGPPVSLDVRSTPEAERTLPGTILQAGKDQRGDPILYKKTWTRGDVERTYPPVTFTPGWTVPVTVHRITYQLVAGKEVTVPKIIRDVYDERMRIQHRDFAAAYPAPSPDQTYQLNEAARRQPGTRVFSSLHHTGTGLNIHSEQPEGGEAQQQ